MEQGEKKVAVISVVNYKGGVGKTSIVANLAVGLATKGHRVLVVDLDPQASLTFSFISVEQWGAQYKENHTIKKWYDSCLNGSKMPFETLFIENLAVNQYLKTPITLISSHTDLFKVEIELAQRCLGVTRRKQIRNKMAILYLLDQEIEKLKEQFDMILIDCQPSFGIITQSALVTSDYYLVPTRLDYLSSLGGLTLKGHVEELAREMNKNIDDFGLTYHHLHPQLMGTVATMVQTSGDDLIAMNKQYEREIQEQALKYFNTRIRFNQSVMGQNSKIPTILRSKSGPMEKKLAEEFESLLQEVMQRMEAQG